MLNLKNIIITILFFKFSFCFAQSTLFGFSTWPTGSTDITNTQGTCTMRTQVVGSSFLNSSPRYDDAGVSWSPTNGTGLFLDHNWSNTSTSTTVTLTFNPAILNPTFSIYDINRNNPCYSLGCSGAWADKVTVNTNNGTVSATAVQPSEQTISNSGTSTVTVLGNTVCNGVNGAVNFTIAGSPTVITITYSSGAVVDVASSPPSPNTCSTGGLSNCLSSRAACSDPGRQFITIGGISGNTCCLSAPTVPTFNAISPVCIGAALSPLPTTSNNGVTGTWSPALNNTATTTYTFTPNAGQCATTSTLTITVNPVVVPVFTQVNPICNGASLIALPTTSNNGITGTWSPALNNAATTTYTFTPNVVQCATTASMSITVNQPIVPTFDLVGPICTGAPSSPLLTTSNNNITGSWSPSINNAATATYTFTPNAGQCASSTTMTITVGSPVTPIFNAINPICSGAVLSPLPATSNNGITGAWSPSLNNAATTTYTFTPLNGQCATSVDMTITVNSPSPLATFPIIGTLCLGSLPPVLNSVSINGISGTWSSQVSTAVSGAQTYTFTPDPGECGVPTSIDVIVADPLTPVFNPLQDICQNDLAPALSNISNNGISGVWSSQINSAVIGVQIMNFTPDNGQCALSTSVSLTINALPIVNAGNDAVLCAGEQITINATGANTYTWSNGLSNGLTMAPAIGTNTYSAIGTDLNGCSSSDQLIIIVNPLPTVYAGSDQTICQGASITLSGSGALSYTWDNAVVNGQQFTPSSGILVYTVEGMDQNGCIGTDQVNINVIPTPVANFQVSGSGCVPLTITLQNSTPNATSCEWMISNGDVLSGCNTVTTELLQAGCYDVTLTTEVNGCTASFTAVDIVCAEDAPDADFTFSPYQITTLDTEVEFQNLSSGASSYIWDFGDNSVQSSEVDPVHEYSNDTYGNYEVMLVAYSQSGCSDTAFAIVNIKEELLFWVPNTFSPDDDTYNQTFDPVFTSGFDPYNYHLTIFNRWGEIVFESYNHEIGWDGTYGGVSGGAVFNCQDGTYTWKIKFKARTNGEQIIEIGHVNLIR